MTLKFLASTLLATAAAVPLSACGGAHAQASTEVFSLSSPDLVDGLFPTAHLANGFGCTGGNLSPALVWSHVPAGTQSFALQVHDPDAPTGSGFWHWTVYNIPAHVTALARGAGGSAVGLPAPAFGGHNDFHDTGVGGANGNYGGPCPPVGDAPHRYVFTLYALSVPDLHVASGIPRTGTAALHGFVLNRGLGDKVLAKASFTARHGR